VVIENIEAKASNDFTLLLDKIEVVKKDEFDHNNELVAFRKLREETETA
jgi:hypothetical protein